MYDSLLNSTLALALSLSGSSDVPPEKIAPPPAYVVQQPSSSESSRDAHVQSLLQPVSPPPAPTKSTPSSSAPEIFATPVAPLSLGGKALDSKAIQAYIRTKNKSLSEEDLQAIVLCLLASSEKYKIDVSLLMAIMEKESTFNPYIVYKQNYGLMQINLPSAGNAFTPETVLDIAANIDYGAKELRANLDDYADDYTGVFEDQYSMVEAMALTAYNQGSGTVRRGTYTMTYASKIYDAQEKILKFLLEYSL